MAWVPTLRVNSLSKLAVDHIPHLYAKYDDIPAPEALRKSVVDANTEIHRRGQANEDFHNMGTTCSVLSILPQGAVVAHVGDSRVYRLRKNRLEQLTFDHSLVWEMRASGQLSAAEETLGKIPKNVITRSLGPYAESNVDLEGPFPIKVGDTFLLCTDGLTGMVEDAEIGSIIANLPPGEAVNALVDLGNLRGGPDNITCIIVRINHPQMATSAGFQATRGGGKINFPVHPVSLAVLAASALATFLFYLLASWQASLVPGVFAAGCLIWILIQLIRAVGPLNGEPTVQHFGRGPYVKVDCASGMQVPDHLKKITDELIAAAKKQNWKIDYKTLDAHLTKAEQATQKGTAPEAVKAYARCISFLMDQLRNQSE